MLTFVSKLVHYSYSSIAWIGSSCKNYGRSGGGYGRYSSLALLLIEREKETRRQKDLSLYSSVRQGELEQQQQKKHKKKTHGPVGGYSRYSSVLLLFSERAKETLS